MNDHIVFSYGIDINDCDQAVFSYEGIEYTEEFDDIKKLYVYHELMAFPKNIGSLLIEKNYTFHDFFNVFELDFPYLTRLKLTSMDTIWLRQWNIPSLKELNIVNSKNCNLKGCNLSNLKLLLCDVSYEISRDCILPTTICVVRYDHI